MTGSKYDDFNRDFEYIQRLIFFVICDQQVRIEQIFQRMYANITFSWNTQTNTKISQKIKSKNKSYMLLQNVCHFIPTFSVLSNDQPNIKKCLFCPLFLLIQALRPSTRPPHISNLVSHFQRNIQHNLDQNGPRLHLFLNLNINLDHS